MRLDPFGSIRTHWDAFGRIRKHLEAFGRFRKNFEILCGGAEGESPKVWIDSVFGPPWREDYRREVK